MTLTQEELKSLLSYDPETGEFTWLVNKGSRARKNTKAGSLCKTHGYVFIRLNKKAYRAHHLAWLYVNGVFPTLDIDHVDQQRHNNKLKNLREVTRSVNNYNTNKRKGYCFSKQKNLYRSYIVVDGKQKHLGYFTTEEQAKEAYEREKQKYRS